jgi:UDP-glucose 4-epimerase
MSILVTGGAGYIGSHAVIDLLSAGEEVVVLDNLSTGFDWAVQDAARLYTGDIADTALVDRILRDHAVEGVIHFAGSIVVPESVSDPLKYYLNNTAKSRSLIESCVADGVRHFIFSSTAAVYGMLEVSPATEAAVLNPMSPYGRSKLMTEWMLQDVAAAHDLTYAALRYFNVAGADPEGRVGQSTANATHLIKVACQTALGQRPYLEVFGDDYPTPDGTCVRDYIHVSDLANAHTAALHYLRKGGESIVANCGYGRGFSVREVLGAVERAAGHSFEVRQAPRRPGDPASIVADPARVKNVLGWQPAHADLDMIVTHALAWESYLRERNR